MLYKICSAIGFAIFATTAKGESSFDSQQLLLEPDNLNNLINPHVSNWIQNNLAASNRKLKIRRDSLVNSPPSGPPPSNSTAKGTKPNPPPSNGTANGSQGPPPPPPPGNSTTNGTKPGPPPSNSSSNGSQGPPPPPPPSNSTTNGTKPGPPPSNSTTNGS